MFLITSTFLLHMCIQLSGSSTIANEPTNDPAELLIGTWQIDLTPDNTTDDNFAIFVINDIDDSRFFGEFYRSGVKIQKGHLNVSLGTVFGALISADQSGSYASSFYFDNGKLHGTTHALERDFLAVWTATKQESGKELKK